MSTEFNQFNVGDRVIVTKETSSTYGGKTGVVSDITTYAPGTEKCKAAGGPYIGITLEGEGDYGLRWFQPYQLYKNHPLNGLPESYSQPQPQQTNQNQDTMKPYAVIVHQLAQASQATISAYFATEAEAKEHAEVVVASYRSNLQAKQWFTVTILNTKTGTLVGSVTDAPPSVSWAAN